MTKYVCWGDDHEDLTEKVREKVICGIEVFGVDDDAVAGEEWRVIVRCDANDHENVFSGTDIPEG